MPTAGQMLEAQGRDLTCLYWKCPHMSLRFGRDGGLAIRACGHPERRKEGIDLREWPYAFPPRECPLRRKA